MASNVNDDDDDAWLCQAVEDPPSLPAKPPLPDRAFSEAHGGGDCGCCGSQPPSERTDQRTSPPSTPEPNSYICDDDDDDDDFDYYYDDDDDWQCGQGFNFSNVQLSPPSTPSLPVPAEAPAPLPALNNSPLAKKRKPELDDTSTSSTFLDCVTSTPLYGDVSAAGPNWERLFQRHRELLESKGKIHGRRFNKTALDLLNAFADAAKSGPPLPPPPAVPSSSKTMPPGAIVSAAQVDTADWALEKEALSDFRTLLLNSKEQASEDLCWRIVHYIEQKLSPLLTADEKQETLLRRSMAFLQELGPALSLKTAPIVRSCVSQLFDHQMDAMFVEIKMPEMPLKKKSLLYRRMLSRLLDDDSCVTFAATNRLLLGQLAPRDLWFLTFFAMVTSRRVRGDNLLQLGVVGNGQFISLKFFLLNTHKRVKNNDIFLFLQARARWESRCSSKGFC